MDIRKRLLAQCATPISNEEVKVDLSGFVLRLLLFEKVILKSVRLKEFPMLVRAFGFDAVKALLSEKVIDISCQALTTGQIGQFPTKKHRVNKRLLPFGSYSFALVSVPDQKQYINECLQPLQKIQGINQKQFIKLKGEIVSRLVYPTFKNEANFFVQFKNDLRMNTPHIKKAVSTVLSRELKTEVTPSDFALKVHAIDDEDFETETNISDLFRITDEEAHKVVERGLLAVGGLAQRIAEMHAHTALSGFRDDDLPIFESKLDFLRSAISPDRQEERMNRVLSIKGFQDLDDLINRGQVDLEKLTEIRETKECKEFREWLWSVDSLSDNEIEERIKSLRSKLSWFFHKGNGKAVRWLTSIGVGLLPYGSFIGGALGYLDTFLLEKILPQPGPISFINELYPSIFREDPLITPRNFKLS